MTENHNKCLREGEIATLKAEQLAIRETQKEIKDKVNSLGEVYDIIHELTLTVTLSSEIGARTSQDVTDIKADLKELKNKDGDKYRDIMSNMTKTILALVLGYLFSKVL